MYGNYSEINVREGERNRGHWTNVLDLEEIPEQLLDCVIKLRMKLYKFWTIWSLYIIFLFAFFLVFASSYLSVPKFHIIFLSLLLLNVIHG